MGSTKAPPKPSSSSNRFATIAAAIYGAVVCVGMRNHEMWRDELEVFAKIRDNTLVQSLTALDDPTLYFYSLLSVVKLFGSSPIAYQAFHGIVATLAVFVFCRFGCFTRTQKILFIFGYFALFDYGIISRDYSFSLLLTWIGVAVVARRPRRYVLSAVVLGLVATHGMYTLFISLGLTAYLVVELGMRARDRGLPAALRRELAIAAPLLEGEGEE